MAVDFVASSDNQSINMTLASGSGSSSLFPTDCSQQTLNGYTAYFCTGVMTGLQPATKYTYSIGNAVSGWSDSFTFTNQPSDRSPIFAIYADFGYKNDVSLNYLIEDSKNNVFDYVIHAGDHAYDLDSSNSQVGNEFMNGIQPYAAVRPYMASPGNHEAYGTQGGGNFTQFYYRYRALAEYAGKNSGSNSNFWYSFETPFIHWLAFTAETWTMSPEQLATQLAFVNADLAKVNRTKTPFVVAFSHKSFQMDQTTQSLFDFLANNNVDLQIVGHWHLYSRLNSIDSRNNKVVIDSACLSPDNRTYTNAKYPIIVVVGAPGDQEVNPRTCEESYQINCSGNYGYGYLQAMNMTHLHATWHTTVPVAGSPDPNFSDDFWIVKTN
jgi:hypothetical protein